MSKTNTYLFFLIILISFSSCKKKRHANVSGNVFDAYTNQPLTNKKISLFSLYSKDCSGKGLCPGDGQLYETISDNNGYYSFSNVTFKKPEMEGLITVEGPFYSSSNAVINKNEVKFFGIVDLTNKNITVFCNSTINLFFQVNNSINYNWIKISKAYIHQSPIFSNQANYIEITDNHPTNIKILGYNDGKTIIKTELFNNQQYIQTKYDTIISPACGSTINYTIAVN